MASDVSVPNSFSNGLTADAPDVNANFAALVSWINTNTMQIDGSKAFTGVPSGPATDPTTANQLTRKAYVDAKTWGTANITDGSITYAKLAANSVDYAKIVDDGVTGVKIAPLSISTAKLIDLSVTTAKIDDLAVTTGKLAANAVTAAKIANNTITNTQMSDANYTNIKNSKLSDYCGRAIANASQSIPNNTWTEVQFAGSDPFDYGNMHDPVTNNTRITAVAAGIYHIDAMVPFPGNTTGGRQARIIRYNSGGVLQDYVSQSGVDAGDSTEAANLVVSATFLMTAGDYVTVECYQNSGAAMSLSYFGIYANASWHCLRLN